MCLISCSWQYWKWVDFKQLMIFHAYLVLQHTHMWSLSSQLFKDNEIKLPLQIV